MRLEDDLDAYENASAPSLLPCFHWQFGTPSTDWLPAGKLSAKEISITSEI